MAYSSIKGRLSRGFLLGAFLSAGTLGSAQMAMAQVAYDQRPVLEPFSPYDESYGVSPSFQIFPRYDGAQAVRVVQHCQYPDGWNVTDFARDVNGTPAGVEHACRPSRIRGRY